MGSIERCCYHFELSKGCFRYFLFVFLSRETILLLINPFQTAWLRRSERERESKTVFEKEEEKGDFKRECLCLSLSLPLSFTFSTKRCWEEDQEGEKNPFLYFSFSLSLSLFLILSNTHNHISYLTSEFEIIGKYCQSCLLTCLVAAFPLKRLQISCACDAFKHLFAAVLSVLL